MPVTTRAAAVEVKPLARKLKTLSPLKILKSSCPDQYDDCSELLETSFGKNEPNISPNRNGFVSCALDAWSQHNHLILRPEDVWFAILTQFSFYVNRHSEELRSFFVSFEGKRKLEIVQEYPINLETFALDMANQIAKNINNPSLQEWIMPSFTTTTDMDKVVASVLMMGTMKKYFVYALGEICGIPSVTLLGEKSD